MGGTGGDCRVFHHSIDFDTLEWPGANSVRDRCLKIAESTFEVAVADIAQSMGFDYFSFVYGSTHVPPSDRPVHPIFISNYSDEWCTHYAASGYAPVDPIVHCAKHSALPFAWGCLDRLEDLPDPMRELIERSWDFEIFNGVSVPVHGPNGQFMLLSMSINGSQKALLDRLRKSFTLLRMLTPFVAEAATRTLIDEPEALEVDLTDQEKSCLYWTAQGKTSWEVAQILGRSKATVEYHLQKSMRKLNVFTKTQAAAMTLRHGLL